MTHMSVNIMMLSILKQYDHYISGQIVSSPRVPRHSTEMISRLEFTCPEMKISPW